MKTLLSLLLLVAFAVQAQAQKVMNFDKTVNQTDQDIIIQPPAGKTWTIVRGSFAVTRTIQNVGVTVYEQEGVEPGLCTNLIRVDLSNTAWVPIVGGYVSHPAWGYLRGQEVPIVLAWPNRLVIHLSNLTQSLRTFTRFTVLE
jgi:hypothetical protein